MDIYALVLAKGQGESAYPGMFYENTVYLYHMLKR